jgi:hypothetical protein
MADIARFFGDRTLILLSNREPYEHVAGTSVDWLAAIVSEATAMMAERAETPQ